ncbi:Cu(I)/Ag(I) efflux system membrane fusion protein [Alteromonadaceae bacterium 2753L.S.0a.02]|nr:Cu(I)/Ag(I) efflux system membrane fusion protein [Alteromonadaceae bacterium 2753L.S.0a.02]
MTSSKNILPAVVVAALIGLGAGVAATLLLSDTSHSDTTADAAKPLYWVAPMDPNYRRDKPGKSPMGMDLIPVYEEAGSGAESGPGTITISPEVINNLGVRTAVAERKTLHSEIISVGYVKYDEERLVHIHPRVSGWVEKLYVKSAGDPVTKNAPLYTLYSPELVNAQEELVLALTRADKRLLDAAKSKLRALQISNQQINTLTKTREVQQTVTFYAPQDGVVDNLNIREGFYVEPGTTMLSVGSLDEVWVEGEIFERQASLVKRDDTVTMTLDYLPGKTWQGKVDYIYPTLDSATRTVRIRLRFANPNKQLKPNMFAQIAIHSESPEQTLVIPREALIRTGKQDRVVLALGEGRFKSVAVKAGQQDLEHVEILDGLNDGEEIVSSAQFLLDSESSKTSDFKRMHHEHEEPESVWVAAEVLDAMPEARMVTVQHEPVEAWGWPDMMMDFQVAEDVDISQLTPGTKMHMQIRRPEGAMVEIFGVHIMSHGNAEDAESEGGESSMEGMDHNQMDQSQMNQSQMDQSQMGQNPMNQGEMDHSQMDHSQMNHSQMNHGEMDHSQHQPAGE